MTPFFRRIRQKLANDNQFLKYSRYAIGEIVLVVIGILIALTINNWNEDRKATEKLDQLFVKVQKELLFNINKANGVIEDYRLKDSLIYKVLNRELSADDYMSSRYLMYLGTAYDYVGIADDAYKSLVQLDSPISKQQDSILTLLKELYGGQKKGVDRYDGLVEDSFVDFQKKIQYEEDWYYNMFAQPKYTDEMIQYFLTNSFYYNHIVNYQNIGLDNHFYGTLSFKIMATNIYEIISNQLSLEKDSIVVKDLQEFEHYIGNYESPTISIIVKEENNNLKVKTVRKKDSLFRTEIIVPHSKAFFTIFNDDDAYFGQLIFDENDNVTGFRKSKGTFRRDYKKID